MEIEKFTFGMGDRFAHQGRAQLRAVIAAREQGIRVHPVWNKSNREHTIVHSHPSDVRAEADDAVRALGWDGSYYVDADHIGLKTVEAFLEGSDFFTLDVADFVGKSADAEEIDAFLLFAGKYVGTLVIPGIEKPFDLTESVVREAASKFLLAMREAGRIYRHIADRKGVGHFVTEVSVDETDAPQNPLELFLILAMLAESGVPVQTIAPKFTGRFNKGVDYVGDLAAFSREFDEDISVIAYAVSELGLPRSLKLSVHSGSDKFAIYPAINRLVRKHGCGLHVKTAGTTWLEEMIGLAESGGEGLEVAREVYAGALSRYAELTGPYATVLAIDPAALPTLDQVNGWSADEFAGALRHDSACPQYNLHFRQLMHVGFKIAAEMGQRYRDALVSHEGIISRNVTNNLLNRHLVPIFGGVDR